MRETVKTFFRPRLPNHSLSQALEVLYELQLFGVNGFGLHVAASGHGFSVSHLETGLSSTTPVG